MAPAPRQMLSNRGLAFGLKESLEPFILYCDISMFRALEGTSKAGKFRNNCAGLLVPDDALTHQSALRIRRASGTRVPAVR